MRILIVEDDASLRAQIVTQLRSNRYAVDEAETGTEGLYYLNEFAIDLAIVDVGLPEMTGFEVVRKARASGKNMPILFLTARDRWQDKVDGLESGGDDYLTKPFRMEELLARIRALLRRSRGNARSSFEFGPLVLDTTAQSVTLKGEVVSLTAFEYKLLEYLIMHAGEVVSKTELTNHTYENDEDRDSNVLEVLIGRIRKKLDPKGKLNPIETLRGRGYRFTLTRSISRKESA